TRAAVESLLAARRLGPTAMHRAFVAARTAIRRRAKGLGASTDDLATTLHVVAVTADRVHAASVGDGAILSAGTEGPQILLPPPDAEYANEVVPVTAPSWRDHFRVGIEVAPRNVFLLTDGLTRLLMTRQAGVWKPFGPFFDRFLPRMAAKPFDPTLVRRFLDSDAVDHAWDDDKCLVVIGVGADAC
ncbi:MAG TPA: protein phosphatase 2C domain-containing protein, partial [Candidatus Thermoplasmatota archaeon]|nr:protein phosphatase 2C domain-containing protein [Candidatus Thermoplasmatota archaeon]